jgi:alanine racemase
MSRPLEARVDLGAIKSNLNVLSSLAPDSMVMAVLKANAYGHGTAQVGLALNRADAFAVISIDEAIVLRNAGITKPIVLLEGFFSPHELYEVYRYQLTPVLHCKEQVEALERATFLGRLNVIVKLNTGMNRWTSPALLDT